MSSPVAHDIKSRRIARLSRPILAVICVAVIVAAISGCSSTLDTTSTGPDSPSAATGSGINGLMTIEGGPIATTPRPAFGERVDVHEGSAAGEVVATLLSGADGAFKVALPPGRYTVVPVTDDDKMALPATVTVSAGTWVDVSVGFSVR